VVTPDSQLLTAVLRGDAAQAEACLHSGANPRRPREDGLDALSLAVSHGRRGVLGVLLRHDAALLTACDGAGRTLVHLAVAARDATTLKYLLGRWGLDEQACAVDTVGNSPLHLCRGPREVWLLLLHGSAAEPLLEAQNLSGETPADCAARASGGKVSEARRALLELAAVGASGPASEQDTQLFSFLRRSHLRRQPGGGGGEALRCWCARARPADLLLACSVWPLAGVACAVPLRFAAAAACAAAAWGLYSRCRRPRPSLREQGRRAALGEKRGKAGVRAALGLFVVICGVCAADSAVLGVLMRRLPACAACWTCSVVAMLSLYARVALSGPGIVASRDVDAADTARAYWSALEACDLQQAAEAFCLRSEARRPPRSRFSPMSGALVACMDHDCLWFARCIGEANHRSFVAFLLCAEAVLCLPLAGLIDTLPTLGADLVRHWPSALPPLGEGGAVALVRLAVLFATVKLILVVWVTVLLRDQLRGIWHNVTTVEAIDWLRRSDVPRPTPARGPSAEWSEFAPHDAGSLRNVVAFLRGRRSIEARRRRPSQHVAQAVGMRTNGIATSTAV